MANPTPSRTLPRWLPRLPALQRDMNFGALFVMLICVNGGIALLAFLMRTRIYDDQLMYVYLLAIVASSALAAWWYLRAPLKGQEPRAEMKMPDTSYPVSSPARKKHKRDKKNRKHRH